MSIFTVKSRWDSEVRRMQWLVLRGAAVIATRSSRREAESLANGLRLACDPWQAFQDARQQLGADYEHVMEVLES